MAQKIYDDVLYYGSSTDNKSILTKDAAWGAVSSDVNSAITTAINGIDISEDLAGIETRLDALEGHLVWLPAITVANARLLGPDVEVGDPISNVDTENNYNLAVYTALAGITLDANSGTYVTRVVGSADGVSYLVIATWDSEGVSGYKWTLYDTAHDFVSTTEFDDEVGLLATTADLETVEGKADANTTLIEGLDGRVETLETDVGALQTTVGGHTTAIGTLESKVGVLEGHAHWISPIQVNNAPNITIGMGPLPEITSEYDEELATAIEEKVIALSLTADIGMLLAKVIGTNNGVEFVVQGVWNADGSPPAYRWFVYSTSNDFVTQGELTTELASYATTTALSTVQTVAEAAQATASSAMSAAESLYEYIPKVKEYSEPDVEVVETSKVVITVTANDFELDSFERTTFEVYEYEDGISKMFKTKIIPQRYTSHINNAPPSSVVLLVDSGYDGVSALPTYAVTATKHKFMAVTPSS
jgi:hypothetical protein